LANGGIGNDKRGARAASAEFPSIQRSRGEDMKTGFIGLGTMGGRMAANLQRAGHELVVTDRVRQSAAALEAGGAAWAASPAEVAAQADVLFLSLPGPPEVESVVLGPDGVLAGARPGLAVFDLSTNSPRKVRDLHAKLAAAGVELLDAPISGGPKGAEKGTLAVWVSGARAAFDRYKVLLDTLGDDVQHLGEVGNATVAKLVNNCIGYSFNVVVAEMFTVGVKAGVPPELLFKALRSGGIGRRRTFDQLPAHFLAENYDPPNFALKLAHKDVALAAGLGREVGVPTRLVQLVLEEMTEARNRGWDDRDSRVAMLLQQQRAGVSVKCDPAALQAIMSEGQPRRHP
jgi:3-hydroxyisobutyrate dehydrogenase-like beta-hydroxyacid dehydrogenase